VVVAVVWRLLPPSAGHPSLAGASFLQIVVTVWIIASTCEEVLYRGLIQSFLEPLRVHGLDVFGVRLSLPVIAAALLFGCMHIMLLTAGADGFLVGGIVGTAIVVGLMAGYYREKSGSLVPAILVHMLFNAYGGVSEHIQKIVGS
jgi:membrane protease YdiL (CAAX protease family)